jgi:succinylglutamate desuccinylase
MKNRNKKFSKSSENRTLILDLHEAIKYTPNSYFMNLQALMGVLKMYDN